MSNRARDWAWAQPVTPTQKLVLLSLAEHANDQGGSCFPCSATLRELTGLSERAIRMALRELESLGLIDCRRGRGKTSSRYRLHVSEGHEVPVTDSRGARDAGQRGSKCPSEGQEMPVRGARDAPVTINKPSINRQRTKKGASAPVVLPDWMDGRLWADFLAHRKAIKAPMSEVAQSRALNALAKLREEGNDPQAVLEQSIVNGWKGLFPVKAQQLGRQGPASIEAQRMGNTVNNLQSLFGEYEHGQADLSAFDGLPGGGVHEGDHDRAGGGLLGPAGEPGRRRLSGGGAGMRGTQSPLSHSR